MGEEFPPPTSVSGRGVQEALVLLRSRLQIPSSQNLEIPVVVRPPVDRFDFDEHVKFSSDPVVVLPSRSFGGVEMEAEAVADVDSVFVDKAVTVSSSSGGGGLGSSVSVFERDDEDEFVISRSAWIPPTKKRIELPEKLLELLSPAEKPLVSARFGHRKLVKVTPEDFESKSWIIVLFDVLGAKGSLVLYSSVRFSDFRKMIIRSDGLFSVFGLPAIWICEGKEKKEEYEEE
ncbi:hypothetical protein LINPERHAP2_LOCUS39146 [Linum perenne]